MNPHNKSSSQPTDTDKNKVLNKRYMLTERRATGGMANVYRAKDLVLQRVVAVKILREEFAADQDLVDQFLREARAVAHLSHTNVVAVYDVGSDVESHYMVLEHVSGHDLKHHIILDAPFSTDIALEYVICMCAGIGHAHKQGLVHCDVKPHNILVTDDGQIKVADFGISRLIKPTEPFDQIPKAFGTPHYFSPEQAQGYPATPASDVYSLGIVLFEMLTGRLPFESDQSQILGHMHMHVAPPDIRTLNQGVPDTLSDIITKVLTKEPSARYRTAQHLGHVLETYRNKGAQATKPYLALSNKELDKHILANMYENEISTEEAMRNDFFTETDWISYLLGATAVLLVLGLLALWTRVYWKLAPLLISVN